MSTSHSLPSEEGGATGVGTGAGDIWWEEGLKTWETSPIGISLTPSLPMWLGPCETLKQRNSWAVGVGTPNIWVLGLLGLESLPILL